MYNIIKEPDGSFICIGYYYYQDGYDTWKGKTLKEAVKKMKSFAEAYNNTRIKKKDMSIVERITTYVPQEVFVAYKGK